MKITLKNRNIALEVECENYSITPKFTNIWIKDFQIVATIVQHHICEAVRLSLLNCNYESWQIGFRTEDIKVEV